MDQVEFGRYRLLSLIGEGAMGKVYKAHDTVIQRDVALKVLAPNVATEPGYEERFRREAHIAARLSEPHIIPIYDTGEIDGRLFLVMPVVHGVDLHTLLQRDGPTTPQRAVHVIEQLAAALDAAHEAGLVHRDVKPSNALVTGQDFVYLIDFGIAHDSSATRLTGTGMMIGTMAYMAPERFMAGTADSRADVYALACVLHECLTGATPYPGESLEQQIAGHLTVDPPKPSRLRDGIGVAFDQVIATGMAKKPDDRYRSAYDLASAARRALSAGPAHYLHKAPRYDELTRPVPAPTERPQAPLPVHPAPVQRPPDRPPAPQPFEPDGGSRGWAPQYPPQPQPQFAAVPTGQPAPQRGRPQWLIPGIAALIAVVAVVGAGIVAIAVTNSDHPKRPTTTATATTTRSFPTSTVTTPSTAPTVASTALGGLLLSAAEANTIMGATAMTADSPNSGLYDDSTNMSPANCLFIAYIAETKVYAGSGWIAAQTQRIADPTKQHLVYQAVVSFPTAEAASAFVSTSTQSWSACANSTYSLSDNNMTAQWKAGPLSTANGILSITKTQQNANGWTAQRALTASNNVVIDVSALSYHISDQAVSIASQMAAKVPK